MPDPARLTKWNVQPGHDVVVLAIALRDCQARLAAAENVVEATRGYSEAFAKRGIQTAESMAAWDAIQNALAAYDAQKEKPWPDGGRPWELDRLDQEKP